MSVAGLERVTTWLAVSALSYRATQVDKKVFDFFKKLLLSRLLSDDLR